MQHLTSFQNVADEAVANLQSLLNHARRTNDQIHRKPGSNRLPDSRRLLRAGSLMIHDDEQIDIGVFVRLTVRIRTEQHDTIRCKSFHNCVNETRNAAAINHDVVHSG